MLHTEQWAESFMPVNREHANLGWRFSHNVLLWIVCTDAWRQRQKKFSTLLTFGGFRTLKSWGDYRLVIHYNRLVKIPCTQVHKLYTLMIILNDLICHRLLLIRLLNFSLHCKSSLYFIYLVNMHFNPTCFIKNPYHYLFEIFSQQIMKWFFFFF